MVNAIDARGAFGHHSGNDERRAGAQIGGHDCRAGKFLHAVHNGAGAFDGNLRAEPFQFLHVHEAAFKNALGDDADAGRLRHEGHHLRLHIGGKTGVGQGGDVNALQAAPALEGEFAFGLLDLHAALAELFNHGFHVIGPCAFKGYLAFRRHAGDGVSGGLDAIGDDFVLCAAQLLDTGDGERGRTEPLDLRADAIEKLAEVHHLRFARGVFNDGDALGQSGGHHCVGRAKHRGSGAAAEEHFAADELACFGDDVAVFDFHFGAERFHRLAMKIHRARANRTAAGQRHGGFFQTRQQRSEHTNGAAHFSHQLGLHEIPHLLRAHGDGVALDFCFGTEAFQNLAHCFNVGQIRHAMNDARFAGEQRGGKDRQHGVFCTTDFHLTMQRGTSFDF